MEKLRQKRFIVSFAHLEMLLRGEHHYNMKLGIPDDAKIVSFRVHNHAIPAFDILIQSEEFEEIEVDNEVDNGKACRTYGSLALEAMPCMPIQGVIIKKQ